MNAPQSVQRDRPGEERLLTADEVADRLQVSLATVRRLKRRGELPYVRIGAGSAQNVTVRYRAEDVVEFVLRCRRVNSHAQPAFAASVRR